MPLAPSHDLNIAQPFITAREQVSAISDFSPFADNALDEAYAIQKQWIAHYAEQGNAISGWKVAMANQGVLDNFNLDAPLHGILFQDMLLDAGKLDQSRFISPRLECELAFILKQDLQGEVSDEDIIAAIGTVAPAFEIADSRTAWSFSASTFLADNAVASGYVMGKPVAFDKDLAETITCELKHGDEVIAGHAEAVLGRPLATLIGSVRHNINVHGQVLAGQHIISGTLTGVLEMVKGTTYRLTMLDQEMVLVY